MSSSPGNSSKPVLLLELYTEGKTNAEDGRSVLIMHLLIITFHNLCHPGLLKGTRDTKTQLTMMMLMIVV